MFVVIFHSLFNIFSRSTTGLQYIAQYLLICFLSRYLIKTLLNEDCREVYANSEKYVPVLYLFHSHVQRIKSRIVLVTTHTVQLTSTAERDSIVLEIVET